MRFQQLLGALVLVTSHLSTTVFAQNAALPKQTSAPTPAPNALQNWVGPQKGVATSTACYRSTHIAWSKKCPEGYNYDNALTCWAECPLEYPVRCGWECLPQNKNCATEFITKTQAVVSAFLKTASLGLFSALTKAIKGLSVTVRCGQQLYNVVAKVMSYIKEVETGGKVDTTKKQLLFLLSKTDFVTNDMPVAVATCIGVEVPTIQKPVQKVVDIVNSILGYIIDKKTGGEDVLKPDAFLNITQTVRQDGKQSSLTEADMAKIKQLAATGVTCGSKIKDIVDKALKKVQELKKANPSMPADEIRFQVLTSPLILFELPTTAVSCFEKNAPDGFKTRDQIIKTARVIIDRVISAADTNGKPATLTDYLTTIGKWGLDALIMFDPTGIAAMAKEYIQPICGPTAFLGEIDDGSAVDALGLTTMQKAFQGTTGTWAKKGDGKLTLTFKSVDTLEVTVNILSAGKLAYQVLVKPGEKVEWSKPLSEFKGKTLYLDRWRAGFLGMPGSGGGSVLAWVPQEVGGSLKLTVPINPTTFSDHRMLSIEN